MITLFLKIKHWQLFIILFLIPIISGFLVNENGFFSTKDEINLKSTETFTSNRIYNFISTISIFLLYGWYWSINIGLKSKIPDSIIMRSEKFKLFFIAALTLSLFSTVYIDDFINGIILNMTESTDLNNLFIKLGGLLTYYLTSLFIYIYPIYLTAKTLKTIELKRDVNFKNFMKEFFLLLFFPIGVWVIQPKINLLMKKKL
jgi:hypothetical protein